MSKLPMPPRRNMKVKVVSREKNGFSAVVSAKPPPRALPVSKSNKANASATIALLKATKSIIERDISLNLVSEEELRFSIMASEDRKRVVKALREKGFSIRQIAEMVSAGVATVSRDLNVPNGTESVPNGTPKTTRQLLGQSDQNDWRTPRKYLDAAREVMGGIDLDPATSAEANETVKAGRYYTEADNGLLQPWKGTVWLNPPYGGDARLFVERLIKEFQVGNVTAACALLNSHPTETKWFQQLFDYTICFIAGRIDFGGPSREVASTSTHGSAIAYLGTDASVFAKTFGQFGAVVARVK